MECVLFGHTQFFIGKKLRTESLSNSLKVAQREVTKQDFKISYSKFQSLSYQTAHYVELYKPYLKQYIFCRIHKTSTKDNHGYG